MFGAKMKPTTSAARARSEPIIAVRFGQRSASTPANGATKIHGTRDHERQRGQRRGPVLPDVGDQDREREEVEPVAEVRDDLAR